MRRLFHDTKLQAQFDRDGFVNIDFMTPSELDTLKEIYREVKRHVQLDRKNLPAEFELSFLFSDPEYRKEVYERLHRFFQPLIDKHLVDYKYIGVNIFDKPPGGNGQVPIHMNWSFVDETEYSSVSAWIPFLDVSREKATIELIRGGHKLQKYQKTYIPYLFDGLWNMLNEKYPESQNLRAGQMGVLDNSIIHRTSDNDSDKLWASVQLIMAPAEAPVQLYYKDPDQNEDRLGIFAVDSEFYQDFYINDKPDLSRSCGFVDYKVPQWAKEEMVEKNADKNADKNPGIRDYRTGIAKIPVHREKVSP
ncbi:MAG: phytanoyl-CoA dioxygenase family protein [Bacteroidetes bacterium]|nr:phytanoyl-CoA dioxygenase family protein [Bacteroidota bacterium]